MKKRGNRMERAVLVGVCLDDGRDMERTMDELKALAFACEMETVAIVIQNLDQVNKALYIGTGKVYEVKETAENLDADIIVFDDALSPSQLRNLQKEIGKPILDRTTLILEIFSRRAKTREAKLQVEVAKLQYMLPRLVGLHEALSRQGGGAGLSNKGSGEKKLELDRRKIEHRITELKKELEEVSKERETQGKLRNSSGILKVALVGYTNAGKSTLMNHMVDQYLMDDTKKVLEKDMLFATLETTVRKIQPDKNFEFLLSDTVGFIDKLPHHLVKAFRSTLEEVKNADLLLLVMDYHDPYYKEHLRVTKETLEELGAANIPVIYVYNKSDLCGVPLRQTNDDTIFMSAKDEDSLQTLLAMIRRRAHKDYMSCEMRIPFERGDIYSYLKKQAIVEETEYKEDGTYIKLQCRNEDYERYKEFLI